MQKKSFLLSLFIENMILQKTWTCFSEIHIETM